MRRIRQRRFPEYLSTIGINPDDFIWNPETISDADRRKLQKRADRIAKKIIADWFEAARAHAAEVEKLVASDREREAAEREAAEAQKIIDRLVEAELPALRAEAARLKKERATMGKAVKRERQKLERESAKLARLKLARFRNRR